MLIYYIRGKIRIDFESMILALCFLHSNTFQGQIGNVRSTGNLDQRIDENCDKVKFIHPV